MKKTLPALLLALTLLTGCTGRASGPAQRSPEELARRYSQAITGHGGEMAEYNPPVSQNDDFDPLLLEFLGLNAEDMTAFSISMSMMNVQAYTIAAVMPAPDKGDAVEEALRAYLEGKQESFRLYLADQHAIASAAKLETLADGTVLLVMCEDQDAAFEGISAAILGAQDE